MARGLKEATESELMHALVAAQRAMKAAKTPKERAAARTLAAAVEELLLPYQEAAQMRTLDPYDAM